MPNDLILVRHGRSEGNLAISRRYQGKEVPKEHYERHDSQVRLTDVGREQARIAGEWLKENLPGNFDFGYVSEYVRARETAACLNIPNQIWHITFLLRERESIDLFTLSDEEHKAMQKAKDDNPFYWRPPGGESVADTCSRVDRVLSTLRDHYEGQKVILVCHGEVMRAFRVRLEHILPEDYAKFEADKPFSYIHNGQVIHYTRRDPLTFDVHDHVRYVRSVCPWDLSRSTNGFVPVARSLYNADQLMESIENTPLLLNEEKGDKPF